MKGTTNVVIHWSTGPDIYEDPQERERQRLQLEEEGDSWEDLHPRVTKVVVDDLEMPEVYPSFEEATPCDDYRRWFLQELEPDGAFVLEHWYNFKLDEEE